MDDILQNSLRDDLVERLWDLINKRKQQIDTQLTESERKYNLRQEQGRLIIESSERKFLQQIDNKNLSIKELDERILGLLEERRIKNEIEPEEEKTAKKSRNKRKVTESELCDFLIMVNFSEAQKQKKEVIVNQINKLVQLMLDAGFKITEQSGNKIQIEIPE